MMVMFSMLIMVDGDDNDDVHGDGDDDNGGR
jgi:hypothetical protein